VKLLCKLLSKTLFWGAENSNELAEPVSPPRKTEYSASSSEFSAGEIRIQGPLLGFYGAKKYGAC
jgi:hypothetical protein